ncbi:acetyl-CoA synthetase-like protein [Favolaschia claudopus]|uniref:Acetyl-CoA synthetase-like protein n=1 Tax=Favolaschia claudopus TaxID=2862362 RepID=A0AAW0DZI8_9AGAR
MLVAAIMRAGLVPFCLSPRNAAAGVASLLKQASCTAVCISENLRHIIEDAFAIHGTSLPVFRAPTFLQMRLEQSTEPLPTLQAVSLDDTAVMLHSSGSTSLYSKPIYLSHKMILQYGYAPWTGNEDHCGQVLGAQTLPNYHAAGIFLTTWPLTSGLTIAVLRPTTPPLAPTPENTLSGVVATKPDIISSTPASIEAWSESSEGIRAMQSLKVLTYTGAPLNKRVGDDLVANGVVLCSFYGAMETGLLMPFLECHGPDWAYLRMRPGIEVKRKPEEDGSPLFTQIYIPSPSYVTCFTNTTVDDGRPGCFVSDLLEPHPEKPDLFRVYGRQDDTIVLSNGFKISPGPLESHINRNPFVNAALVFGQGRPYPGLLIQLAQQGGKVEFKTVDEINKTATTHNRIARKMILLADPEKPFALTSKLQPRRFVVFDQYRDELDAAYM